MGNHGAQSHEANLTQVAIIEKNISQSLLFYMPVEPPKDERITLAVFIFCRKIDGRHAEQRLLEVGFGFSF